jgi:transcriptional regulator with XRE-family HTH domain
MPKHAAVGHRLRGAIQRSGSTQTEIAQRVGISQGYIARMLAGDRSGDDHLQKLAEILGVHERWLRFGDDDVKPPWALSKDLADPLHAVTAAARDYRPRPKLLDVLSEMLVEQRRIRVLLEGRLASQDPPIQRRATIRRAADGDGTPAISTRAEIEP